MGAHRSHKAATDVIITRAVSQHGSQAGASNRATDELGDTAVENKVHMHDLHATLLHILGLDHEKLTYRYAGRDFRLTDVHGSVVHGILS